MCLTCWCWSGVCVRQPPVSSLLSPLLSSRRKKIKNMHIHPTNLGIFRVSATTDSVAAIFMRILKGVFFVFSCFYCGCEYVVEGTQHVRIYASPTHSHIRAHTRTHYAGRIAIAVGTSPHVVAGNEYRASVSVFGRSLSQK